MKTALKLSINNLVNFTYFTSIQCSKAADVEGYSKTCQCMGPEAQIRCRPNKTRGIIACCLLLKVPDKKLLDDLNSIVSKQNTIR